LLPATRVLADRLIHRPAELDGVSYDLPASASGR
jgi:hypothetical protein